MRELLDPRDVVATHGDLDVVVGGLALDSRRVRAGDVFFGLSGLKQDGQAFVRQALTAGAVAAVVGEDLRVPGATLVQVDEPRKTLARASARFFAHPSRALRVVAVTGTNGKTTTTLLLESVFRAAGWKAGVLGTTGVRVDGVARPSAFTTPEAPELQGVLAEMRDGGVGAVALEVSSHALVQRRSFALECDVVVFTNLSHDHLDYHGTLEKYLDAKLMLFDGRNDDASAKRTTAVIDLDDAAAPRVIAAAKRGGRDVRTFGESAGADVRLLSVRLGPSGLDVGIGERGGSVAVQVPLLGRYNAWNAAAAFSAARALGVGADVAARGIAACPGIPGRLERVVAGQPMDVVVDYAHTPDALARALAAAREHARGRVLLVFGCGGDRDRAKRPIMGRLAADGADRAWVTSDNPRTEDPRAIADEILAGAPGAGNLTLELDRRAAIAAALGAAAPEDFVLVAGKGHETTQTIGASVLPFDDRVVARELLAGGAR
ncbi:MAG TPA: UDP-N-acetylmuramoyl-L-alanyl-D-glutamate--2,6-diaminopimelate ligase [Candidatus Saccharimonadaceae bacterium]|nr:UDP-N-acetylmuramoyl-L-alanyl-D-glutamate--2,6-diaminopimelate ligase [Candidatus Saccharimonadaceae bacterium]